MRHKPATQPMTRREALCKMGAGFGMLSLASLLGDTIARADEPANKQSWMIQEPGFKPRARHVIFLFMNGGLSQIDSFDHKPMLAKYDGQAMPGGDLGHERKTGTLMKSPLERLCAVSIRVHSGAEAGTCSNGPAS